MRIAAPLQEEFIPAGQARAGGSQDEAEWVEGPQPAAPAPEAEPEPEVAPVMASNSTLSATDPSLRVLPPVESLRQQQVSGVCS